MPKKGQFKKNAKPNAVRQREYSARPEQKKRRAQRNKIRRKLEREGKVRKGDGKDVDHKNHDTSDMSSKNIQVISRSKNRAMNQHDPRRKKK